MSGVHKFSSRVLPWLLCSITISAQAEDFAKYLHADESLESIFAELNQHGYQISYSSNVVLPAMHLQSVPRASGLESLLREILTPWGLAAVKAGDNDYLVVPAATRTPARGSS